MTNSLLDRFRRGTLGWLVLEAAVLALTGAAAAQSRTQPSQPPGIMVPGPATGSADLTNREGFLVGGRAVRPGGSLAIGPREAARVAGGKCFYEVTYEVTNVGSAPTPEPFTARLRADGSVVGTHDRLTLQPRESRTLRSVIGLLPGQHVLDLVLDDANRVPETDERNNQIRALVSVGGPCDQPGGVAQAPLTTQPGPMVPGPQTRQAPGAVPAPSIPQSPGGPSPRFQPPLGQGPDTPPSTLQPLPGGPTMTAPKLWGTDCSGKNVPPDCRLSRPNLVGGFGRESTLPDTLDWRWQVATQPFPGGATGTPSGLVAQEPIPKKGQASAKFFPINFGKFPPLMGPTLAGSQQATVKSQVPAGAAGIPGAQGGSATGYKATEPPCLPGAQQKVVIDGQSLPAIPCPQPATPGSSGPAPDPPITLYVRIVAFQGGLPVGPPSNVVAVTYMPPPLAQLVALVGPAGGKVERDKLSLHFPWEDAYFRRKGPSVMPQGVYWRWQLASKSFAGTLALKPAGLLADGFLSGSEFSLDLSKDLDATKNLYVRVVPLDNPYGGQLTGAPSNEVVVTYTPYKPEELLPEVHLVSWQGPQGYDWNYRCWRVATRDVYAPGGKTKIVAKGQKSNVCKTDDDNILEDIAEAAEGFVEALGALVDWVSGAFKDLKSSIVNAVASLCGSQKDKCQVVATIALNTGLTALGVPPEIPNFEQLVAQLKQGGVEFLAAELVTAAGAENIPLAQDAAEAAIKKVLDEVEKTAAEGDPKAPIWVPDPAGLYRPAALVLELRNPNFPVAVKVDAIRLTSNKLFAPMEISLKGTPIHPGKTVRVPIFPTPTVAP
ncbi:MAG: hypothetical protein L0214_08955, partial [candidate division NC10 bacterium]|nr:hypothetical protein [candidate division NC10 bacterium]